MDGVRILEGGISVDDRGAVSFVNDFHFDGVKRFYKVENFSVGMIRAFHGHLKEGKYVFVSAGSVILAAVKLDNVSAPDKNIKVQRFILSSRKPAVAYIPPGFANGFKALEEGTQVLFFSTSTLADSRGDDYRYPCDYWGREIWEAENR